jgi:hypothetical protein
VKGREMLTTELIIKDAETGRSLELPLEMDLWLEDLHGGDVDSIHKILGARAVVEGFNEAVFGSHEDSPYLGLREEETIDNLSAYFHPVGRVLTLQVWVKGGFSKTVVKYYASREAFEALVQPRRLIWVEPCDSRAYLLHLFT